MDRRAAKHRRDVGMARLRRLSRWVTAGAVALIGLMSAVVAEAVPGRSAASSHGGATSPTSTPPSPSTTAPAPDPSTTVPGLQPPATSPSVPATAPAPAPVVSGGS